MEQSWLNATYGGVLIGFAAAILLIAQGRVLGVSGIISRIYERTPSDTLWRMLFFIGTALGGFFASRVWPENFQVMQSSSNYLKLAVAGVIVGFGTKLGNGCTSGHGVCGIGRLSPRGIVATCVFMFTAIVTVFIIGR